jgi:hypothetical protein
MPTDSTVLACDGLDIVGMAHYLDLQLTVPGGAVLPMAGITIVAVAPTHRRRGILRTMYTELHNRIADAISDRRPDSQRRRNLRALRIRTGDDRAGVQR